MFNDPTNYEFNRLSLLESRDVVFKAFSTLHNRELNSSKASEIIAHLLQGRSFDDTANDADEIVRPLLRYYSVLSIARAIILILSPNMRECSLPAQHGLSVIGWKELFSSGGSLLDARIRVTRGTFATFAEITANKSNVEVYALDGEAIVVSHDGTSVYPSEFEFTVADIFSRLPSLAKLYEALVEKLSLIHI